MIEMSAFDKAWKLVNSREPCSRCDDADKEMYCHGCGRCSDCCPDWEGHGRGGYMESTDDKLEFGIRDHNEPCSRCDDANKEMYCDACGRCSDCCPDWVGHGINR